MKFGDLNLPTNTSRCLYFVLIAPLVWNNINKNSEVELTFQNVRNYVINTWNY
jgi:hypothetical protein